ncbi:MAG: hypothetical protein FK734_12155 [Asgard group archaeon]|nr:hypothetical protein [Asgard group archaeon]
MSNPKKGKDTHSIITVRAICNICKDVDTFQLSTRDLLPHIGGLYQVSTIHLCKDDKEMVMNIVLDRNYAVRQATVSPFIGQTEVDRWSPEKVQDIRFLEKQVKEANRVIHGVLTSKIVVVAGNNKTFIKRIVHTLELFSPTKYPQSIEWTDDAVTDKKIIGTSLKGASNYPGAVIVDLENSKVLNGKPSPYCKDFLELLVNLEPNGMAYAAKEKIGMLVDFARMLVELSKEPEIGQKALDLVRMDVSSDALELIMDMIHGFDPTATEIIKESWL